MEEKDRKRELELFAALQSDRIVREEGVTKEEINELFDLVMKDPDILRGASRLIGFQSAHLTKRQFNALFDKVAKANNSAAAVRFLLEAESKVTPAQIKKLVRIAKNDPDELLRLSNYASRPEIYATRNKI